MTCCQNWPEQRKRREGSPRGERHDNKATVYHTVRLRHHSIRWVRGPGHYVHSHTWWYGSARGGATVPHDTRQP